MKIRKLASALCLAAGLALSIPTLTSVFGVAGGASTVLAADGWNQDDSGYYYLQNDTRLTGMQTINDATYYFNASGYRVSGSVKVGKSTYYFAPGTGKLCTGYSGLVQIGKGSDLYFYFSKSKNGTVAVNKWVKHKGKYYYADETGQIKFGTIKVGGKLYHVTKNGRMKSYGKSSYDNKYYYASSNGTLLTGLRKIGGKQYYFNKRTGQRQTGAVKVGRSYFYFSTQTGYARTGWVKLSGKYYYYNSNYRRVAGWKTIKGKKYYFNPKNSCARVQKSWCKIGKYYYYFNSKGVLQTGFFKVNGKTYYSDSNGIRRKGWRTVGGRKYYMDPSTGVVKTGWFTYKGNKYYLNPVKSSTYGAAKTGWVKIQGYWYYFNTNGTMKTGWLLDNMKYYYLDKTTGRMYTGKHTIDGKTYDFGSSGGFTAQVSGEWSIHVNRKKCCITIYKGSTPVKAMICSTARDGVSTPTGTFRLLDKLRWHELIGPSWGQYCSHITSDILFHSVTYSRYRDNHSLNASAYNNLGSPASAGCIRLRVIDAKWMYENLPVGTKVVISDSEAMPLGKPSITPIPLSQNYDPTDPYA